MSELIEMLRACANTDARNDRDLTWLLTEAAAALEAAHADIDGMRETIMAEHNARIESEAALEAAREDAWHTMESCPVNQTVLLWNQETGDMCFGYKPEAAPTVDAVVIGWTSSWADAWRPMPSEPQHETYGGPPQLSVAPAIDQARGKGVAGG